MFSITLIEIIPRRGFILIVLILITDDISR